MESHAYKTQKRYKHDYHRKIRETTTLRAGEYVFIYHLPLPETSSGLAKILSTSTCNDLLQRSLCLLRIIKVCLHTLVIDDDGIHNTLFIDRVSHTPTMPASPFPDKITCTTCARKAPRSRGERKQQLHTGDANDKPKKVSHGYVEGGTTATQYTVK